MKGPSRFRKRPVVIEACRVPVWDEYADDAVAFVDDAIAIADWCGGKSFLVDPPIGVQEGIHIETLEGTMVASPGDMIIRGVKGEFYPCKPVIFEASYEPARRGAAVTAHNHSTFVEGCYRCELGRDEVEREENASLRAEAEGKTRKIARLGAQLSKMTSLHHHAEVRYGRLLAHNEHILAEWSANLKRLEEAEREIKNTRHAVRVLEGFKDRMYVVENLLRDVVEAVTFIDHYAEKGSVGGVDSHKRSYWVDADKWDKAADAMVAARAFFLDDRRGAGDA